jgi:hypothetical protein
MKQADPPIKIYRKASELDPLLLAASEGNINTLSRLVAENPTAVRVVRDSYSNLPVHLAAAGGHVAALDCLFQVSLTTRVRNHPSI